MTNKMTTVLSVCFQSSDISIQEGNCIDNFSNRDYVISNRLGPSSSNLIL